MIQWLWGQSDGPWRMYGLCRTCKQGEPGNEWFVGVALQRGYSL